MTDDRDEVPPPGPAPLRRMRRTTARRSSGATSTRGPGATVRAEAGLQPAAAARAEGEAAIEAEAEADAGGPAAPVAAPDMAATRGVGITGETPRPASAGRASATWSCPLLRLLDDEGRLGPASTTVDDWHRCVAVTPPSSLSDRQQTLVCLTEAHVECPRYRHAATPVAVPRTLPTERSGLSPATLAATLVLLMSFLAALSFVAVNGGIGVPTPAPSGNVAAASPSAAPSVLPSPSVGPGGGPSASPAASPAPSAAPASPSPSPSPTPLPPRPRPSPSAPEPSPSSDRYLLLVACPARPDCYRYTVRRGDNLTSIGLYFGVPFDTLLARNPWIRDPKLIRAGDVIEMPPPTR